MRHCCTIWVLWFHLPLHRCQIKSNSLNYTVHPHSPAVLMPDTSKQQQLHPFPLLGPLHSNLPVHIEPADFQPGQLRKTALPLPETNIRQQTDPALVQCLPHSRYQADTVLLHFLHSLLSKNTVLLHCDPQPYRFHFCSRYQASWAPQYFPAVPGGTILQLYVYSCLYPFEILS